MTQIYLYAGAAFIAGFIMAWLIRTITVAKMKKSVRSTAGYLESERLMKENLQKENMLTHQMKQAAALECANKLKEAHALNNMLNEDILLLQKSNEETEALLKAGEPALYELRLKLIEANNTIARYKARVEQKANLK